jgi:hypothetical protein
MGMGDGSVLELKVYESFHDWEHNRPEAVRSRALAKLTKEERQALGVG